MRVIQGLDSPDLKPVPRAVAVGAYDGVHRGHRALLSLLCRRSAAGGLESTAVTLEPLPMEVFRAGGHENVRLTTLEEKLELLRGECLAAAIVLDFNSDLRHMSARQFAGEVLVSRMGTRLLIASETHTFGRGGEADVTRMRELGDEFGFELLVLPLLAANGGRHISSTEIRNLLWAGDVEGAMPLLGRPYSVRGKVVPGRGVGGTIGFATANLELPPQKLIPADGVYAAIARWPGMGPANAVAHEVRGMAAAVSVGTAPTFGLDQRLVEAHLLHDAPSLYGATLDLHFMKRLRGQVRFADEGALAAQIAADTAAVRAAFGLTT